ILDAKRNGLAQMAEILMGRSGIDAIHVVSHGQRGVLKLGATRIDQAALEGYGDELASIGSVLTADGDILLYGCEIADDTAGNNFIEALAESTSADIAASDDLTGAANHGGDWILEKQRGQIDSDAFSSMSFNAVLADVIIGYSPSTSISATDENGVWGQSFTATKTGVLSNIQVLIYTAASADVGISIYSGETVSGGALLASQTIASGDLQNVATSYSDWTTITISSTVNITSGQQYTFAFSDGTSAHFDFGGDGGVDSGLSGARLYSSHNGGFAGGYDLNFRVTQGDPANSAPTENANAGSSLNEGATDTIINTELEFYDDSS
ncbi:MAG: DUF4347 domain-containing protein, partial [Desulfobacterales bacterium]|nr:DUF4347 domain-containing protein [Desulfobacterales bacterium]